MINQKKYNRLRIVISIVIILLFPIYLFFQLSDSKNSKDSNDDPKYVGRDACIDCHPSEYKDWKGSDHDLAMDFANDSTVLGDFNNVELIRNNQKHKCYKKDSSFFVFTDSENGKMQEYQVKYVFGHFPLQNYLVEFPGGRLQTLAMTWNSKDKEWFYMADSVYKNMTVNHNNWLHWTNQAQNWNSMCANCHSTNLKKGYDHKTDSYHTTWFEIDVSCEACHGPASEHLKWANLAEYARKEFTNYGLIIKTSGIDNKEYVDNCARCHSRRNNFSDFDTQSNNIYNYIAPSLPTEPNWYIDGQIHSEDYVYGSFTQSKMYMHDVKCNDCHNVHSGKLLFEDNKLCTQCHIAENYDKPSHTHHKGFGQEGKSLISAAGVKFEVGSGTLCINCHMHGQNFMGVDYRRDHSFRIPRPDLSEKFGSPNACNQCHKDETNQWAQSSIEQWFGKSRHFQYGEAFYNAVAENPHAEKTLHRIIKDELYAPPIRSIALSLLIHDDIATEEVLFNSLKSIEPSIRISAIRRMNINSQKSLDQLLVLLNDEFKAVRLEAFQRIVDIDTSLLSKGQKVTFRSVKQEQYQMLLYNSDFPVGKFNLANYYSSQGEYQQAEKMYLAALQQDSELSAARMNLARLYSIIGQPKKAETQMQQYVKENPTDGAGFYNYGLILSENKKYQQSLNSLLKASELSPENGRIDYNVAMLYEFFGEKDNAEKYLQRRINNHPGLLDAYISLLEFYMRTKKTDKIKPFIETIIIRFPDKQSVARVQSVVYRR